LTIEKIKKEVDALVKKMFLVLALVFALAFSSGALELRFGFSVSKFISETKVGLPFGYGFSASVNLAKHFGLRGLWHFDSKKAGSNIPSSSLGLVTLEGALFVPLKKSFQFYLGLGAAHYLESDADFNYTNRFISTSSGLEWQLFPKVWLNFGANMLAKKDTASDYRLIGGLSYSF